MTTVILLVDAIVVYAQLAIATISIVILATFALRLASLAVTRSMLPYRKALVASILSLVLGTIGALLVAGTVSLQLLPEQFGNSIAPAMFVLSDMLVLRLPRIDRMLVSTLHVVFSLALAALVIGATLFVANNFGPKLPFES